VGGLGGWGVSVKGWVGGGWGLGFGLDVGGVAWNGERRKRSGSFLATNGSGKGEDNNTSELNANPLGRGYAGAAPS